MSSRNVIDVLSEQYSVHTYVPPLCRSPSWQSINMFCWNCIVMFLCCCLRLLCVNSCLIELDAVSTACVMLYGDKTIPIIQYHTHIRFHVMAYSWDCGDKLSFCFKCLFCRLFQFCVHVCFFDLNLIFRVRFHSLLNTHAHARNHVICKQFDHA